MGANLQPVDLGTYLGANVTVEKAVTFYKTCVLLRYPQGKIKCFGKSSFLLFRRKTGLNIRD